MDMPIDVSNNDIIKGCLSHYEYRIEDFDNFNFRQASACFHKTRTRLVIKETAEIREFLRSNPEYRYPGGSNGNIDPCWGQNERYLTNGGC